MIRKFLLIKKQFKEKWIEFHNSEILAFEYLKEVEKSNLFPNKKSPSKKNHEKTNLSFSHKEKTEKKEPIYLHFDNEEDYLNLFEKEQNENQYDSEYFQDNMFNDEGETKLIEEILGYIPTEHKIILEGEKDSNNSKNLKEKKKIPNEFNRKIDFFTLILDFELIVILYLLLLIKILL